MIKLQKSGPAILMYSIIAVTLVISAVMLPLYYTGTFKNSVVLWCGIVAFMIMYHLWVRLIMGNVSKLFNIDRNHWWFREWRFEKKLYKFLQVKKWKGKALTYNPESFSLEKNSLNAIANTMAKSEVDHWINEAISITSIFFSLLWGQFWIFFLTALFAMIFDSQFIIIQRYNRPRVLRIMNLKETKTSTIK